MDAKASLQVDSQPACCRPAKLWLAIALPALVLYTATANRSVEWQDAGIHQVRIVTGTIHNDRGLALTHPVHYYLGRAALHLPVQEPAFAITLVSCVAGAIAVANIAVVVFLLTSRSVAAVLSAAGIALAHIFWYDATHTESYAIVSALLTMEWICLVRYLQTGRSGWVLALAAANGLGFGNHLLAGLVTPIDAIFVLWAVRRQRLPVGVAVLAAAIWIGGSLPFTALVTQEAVRTGDLSATLRSAFFGNFQKEVMSTRINWKALAVSLGMVVYNFPNLMAWGVAAAWGSRRSMPKALRYVLVAELLLFFAFVIRFGVIDQYTFLFVVYLPLVVFAGLGFARLAQWRPHGWRVVAGLIALSIVLNPVWYLTARRVLENRHALDKMWPHKPYRDSYGVFLEPWGFRTHHGTELNAAVRRSVGSQGLVLVGDSMMMPGLQYAAALGRLDAGVQLGVVPLRLNTQRAADLAAKVVANFRAAQPVVQIPADSTREPTWPQGASWRREGDIYILTGL